jgi:hypothetical protein
MIKILLMVWYKVIDIHRVFTTRPEGAQPSGCSTVQFLFSGLQPMVFKNMSSKHGSLQRLAGKYLGSIQNK